MKILVAEDDSVSSTVLAARLRKLGHTVSTAENGKEAWFTFVRMHPRLVITDWMMPEVDGLEFTRRIRAEQRPRYTYVIMLTAMGGKESYLEGMYAGVDDFLTKPVDADTLNARLRVAERLLGLQEHVSQMEELLPICAYCKRIRDGQETWQDLQQYVGSRTDASFQAETCPECHAKESA